MTEAIGPWLSSLPGIKSFYDDYKQLLHHALLWLLHHALLWLAPACLGGRENKRGVHLVSLYFRAATTWCQK